jgi:hypothetical protein
MDNLRGKINDAAAQRLSITQPSAPGELACDIRSTIDGQR